MTQQGKLAALELIGGVFGWIWIVSSVAALYFIYAVIWDDGTWTNFFWAIGAGVISKWLARGFNENKARVSVETHLMEQGMTAEEAAQAYIQGEYPASKSAPSEVDRGSVGIADIISAFGEYLELNPLDFDEVRDVQSLPHPKDQIRKACLKAIGDIANPQVQRDAIEAGLIMLTQFQDDVGSDKSGSTTSILNAFAADKASGKETDPKELARQIASANDSPAQDRHDHFMSLIKAEQAEVLVSINEVKRAAIS